MRIISGQYKNLIIKSLNNPKTRPMSEKMRGAIFSSLGDLSNLKVLDLYAGTGSLGLEALSRGALKVDFVENNARQVRLIKTNLASLASLNKTTVYNISVSSFLAHGLLNENLYDLIFADPPYEYFWLNDISQVINNITSQTILVLSCSLAKLSDLRDFKDYKVKKYGQSCLVYFNV